MYDTKIIDAAIACGASDAGIIDIERQSLKEYKEDLESVMPDVASLLILVYKINTPAIRTIHHSIADLEFRHTWTHANETSRQISSSLVESGINTIGMPVGFPFETSRWPGKMWLTCDKIFACDE